MPAIGRHVPAFGGREAGIAVGVEAGRCGWTGGLRRSGCEERHDPRNDRVPFAHIGLGSGAMNQARRGAVLQGLPSVCSKAIVDLRQCLGLVRDLYGSRGGQVGHFAENAGAIACGRGF